MSHSSPKSDVYQTVTNSIIAMIEAGAGEWRMPWHNDPSATDTALTLPHNPVSGTRYRGINVPLLWCAAQDNNYQSHQWATYKQWSEKKAQVRKGEKATTIVFWKRLDVRPDDEGKSKSIMMARAYSVFNLAQVDGYAPVVVPIVPVVTTTEERDAHADGYFQSIAAAHGGELVRHGGNRAFYAPSRDVICVPNFNQFAEPVDYYSTLAHEHVHYTGHEKRCAREFGRRFGDQAYAFEELVAELGAAFLCASLGLSNTPRQDHAAYLQNWLTVLKSDNRAIFSAASAAQKAVDWLDTVASASERCDAAAGEGSVIDQDDEAIAA